VESLPGEGFDPRNHTKPRKGLSQGSNRLDLKAKKAPPDKIKRVVVRAPNWFGDVVMSGLALRELRRLLPHAHITLAARPGMADVFMDTDFIDEVLIFERSGIASVWKQISEWRRHRFDAAVLFQNAFEAAAIAFLARVPRRIGYNTEGRSFLLTNPLPQPEWKDQRHESFYYLNIVPEVGRLLNGTFPTEDIQARLVLEVSEERKCRARDFLRQQGIRSGAPLVLLCPGSINSRAKRWPSDRYAALSDRLIASGAIVTLIGSPGELDVSQEVCKHAQHRPIVLTGATTVAEATAIVSIADLLITNDTGPAHIGAALNTPTLVIFGPTNPLTTYPMSPNAEVLRRPPDCAPCMLRDCPIDHRCMTAISPDEVFERASALLARHPEEISA
jgi:heptosyltransferase-2